MENITDLYLELAKKIKDNIEEVQHIDLWHNQVNFLEVDHRFNAPAVFFEFRIIEVEDNGLKVQQLKVQVNTFLFYETFLDTDYDAYNKEDAVAFLDTLTKIHKLFHGTSGDNYSSMRRIGFSPVDTGTAGNLYQMPFSCLVSDISAVDEGNDIVDDDGDGQNEFQEYQVD